MRAGELTERYYSGDGVHLEVRVRTTGDRYRVAVHFNGCVATLTTRSSLAAALRWGRSRADELRVLLGVGPQQVALPLAPGSLAA